MRTRIMANLTWPEIKEAVDRNTGIILPIGSTEQHGYHLPICTDTVLPFELGMAISEELDMIVAPPLSYGYRSRPTTGGGQTFIATTSIKGQTLMNVVEDILHEFIRHGFKRIVLLNWHFENANFIYESAFLTMERIKKENPDVKIMVMELPFQSLSEETMNFIFPDEFPGWGIEHASIFETSLMLHLHPELVLFDRAVDDKAEVYPFYDVLPIPEKMVAKSGTLWKATQASAEKGRVAWEELVPMLEDIILTELPKK
ncbi:creatininase [Bacillus sp. FJAT-29790]|uniref:creatininase n=1 Tax=Bacillus sp. FJAT-29790 TaxID=1895002 RepID=UPI001C22BAF8|nr:creatininase [Bacillus sp. FJAT-29790]MBU8878197.1 creatininase [Bacillus sp. FJAT-29790]